MVRHMQGGIIAAGLGSRFRQAGISTPKPLIEIGGRPLISWTIHQFLEADIHDIHVIFRTAICEQCVSFLQANHPEIDFEFICKDTESSAESFLTLLRTWKENQTVLITTVDSIYQPKMLKRLRQSAEKGTEDTLYLGLTSHIEDEKPLYAKVTKDNTIIWLGDKGGEIVTSGAYLLPARIAHDKDPKGYKALRAVLKEFVSSPDITAFGVDLGKVLDVDRPEDIVSAERFIASFI